LRPRRFQDEAGYSLVEVLASIVILTIAIIPMVTMFDTGLRSATTSGNYDKARSLANMKLEEAKSLPYDSATVRDLKDNFPENPPTTTSYSGTGFYQSGWRTETGFSGLEYRVQKQFLNPPSGAASQSFTERNNDAGMMRIVVTVRWGGNSYSATGLVSR
jgi:Tfp pilus assembly protein PilV